MEWSSDGYVLAVGWEKGWAVWSVAGRCLAWGFGLENQTDESKYDSPTLLISAVALNQDFQIQRHVHERYQGPCGPLNIVFESTFSVLNSFGALATSNSLSFLTPINVVSGE